jgi:hypothetical protein
LYCCTKPPTPHSINKQFDAEVKARKIHEVINGEDGVELFGISGGIGGTEAKGNQGTNVANQGIPNFIR